MPGAAFDRTLMATRQYGRQQHAFGTVQFMMVEPMLGAYSSIIDMSFTSSATPQTLTILRELGRTYNPVGDAAGQNVMHVARDPGLYSQGWSLPGQFPNPAYGVLASPAGFVVPPQRAPDRATAGGDLVVYQIWDNTYFVDTVASVAGLAWTMTTPLPGNTAFGGLVWTFGAPATVNPYNGFAHWFTQPPISAATKYGGPDLASGNPAFITALRKFSPLVIYFNNITTDTNSIDYVLAGYFNRL